MKKIILMLMLACGLALNVSAGGDRLVKVAPGYSENSVNTTVFRNNSLVTDGDCQYVCYYDADGRKYDLPIRSGNAGYACRIPQGSELINQTSMSADAEGNPYIATYWRSADSKVPQYRLVWFNGKRWNSRQVSNRTTPFSLSGIGTKMIPVARPRIVVDGKKAYYVFRDEERGGKVSIAYTQDLDTGEWKVADLTDFTVDAWEPSHDTELWKQRKRLHLFVQHTKQGDGEKTVAFEPQPVYVLEVSTKSLK